MWVPLGCSLDWFGAYALVWFGLPLPELWVWYYVVGVLVDQYVRSGLEWFPFARGVGLVISGWYAYWILFMFVAG